MGPSSSNYTAAQRTSQEQAEDARLVAARDAFPGWAIIETFGGYLAVPAGTPLIQSISLDGLVMKLRQH